MRDALFVYACRAPQHQDRGASRGERFANPITVHENQWAYCPSGSERDHDWERLDGLGATLAQLTGAKAASRAIKGVAIDSK